MRKESLYGPTADGQKQQGMHVGGGRRHSCSSRNDGYSSRAGKQKLLKGYTVGDMTYKVHLDGYNLLSYLTGQETRSPRKEFFYFSDEGETLGVRYENWKFVMAEQRTAGTMNVWRDPFTHLRIAKLFNLRRPL